MWCHPCIHHIPAPEQNESTLYASTRQKTLGSHASDIRVARSGNEPVGTYVDTSTSFMNHNHNGDPLTYSRFLRLESLSHDTISNPLAHADFLQLWGYTTTCQEDCDRVIMMPLSLVRWRHIQLGRDASG